jgi:DsbC/DsbD-like thiol-disulfide interchange protein
MEPGMKRRQFLFAVLGLPALSLTANAGAGRHYTARLIGGETQNGIWRAGLDLTLDDGWKTYWRMPGEAGVPPQFDWSGSGNVASVAVLWPAPTRFTDDGGETVGYKGRVVFPLDIIAEDTGKPVTLKLAAFLGVCDIICIPVNLEISLTQAPPAPADASLIAAFAARVPEKANAQSRFHVTSAGLVTEDGKPALALNLAGEGFGKGFDVFVEGSDFAYFRAPRPTGDKASIHLPIDGLKDVGTLRGRTLTLTMISGDIRLEQDVVVD